MQHPRKAVAFELDGKTIESVPTLLKITTVEQRFGPAMSIVDRLTRSDMAVSDMTQLVALILAGCPGAAKRPDQVAEAVYAAGPFAFVGPVVAWLANALSPATPPTEAEVEAAAGK